MVTSHVAKTRAFLALLATVSTFNTYWIGGMFSYSNDVQKQLRTASEPQEWQKHYHQQQHHDNSETKSEQRQSHDVETIHQSETAAEEEKNGGPKRPILDMIAVGSNTRWDLVETQNATFGQHPSVRNFFTFSEADDHEAHCHSNLTMESTRFVSKHCRNSRHTQETLKYRSRFARVQFLQKKENPAGWLCAQKRPAESLFRVLDDYRQQRQRMIVDGTDSATLDQIFPDYLFLLDDDTYLNMEPILEVLPELYPANNSYAVAGCMVRERVHQHNFTFPWGGFGTIFSKALIEKFVHPIHCHTDDKMYDLSTIATSYKELS
ncbi:MAG: hypothetical protein SGILL_007163, partial [Bacillariaceae sp.]